MSSVPQHLGVVSGLNRTQPAIQKQTLQETQFAAQLPEAPAAAQQEALPQVSAQVLKARSGIKFGANEGLPAAAREQLTQQLVQTLPQKNASLGILIGVALKAAQDTGARDVTPGHLVLGLLTLVQTGLTQSPKVMRKAPHQLNATERDTMGLVNALMPSAQANGLDTNAVLDQVNVTLQKVRTHVSSGRAQQGNPIFDQETILLLKTLEQKPDISTRDLPQLVNFLSAEAPALNLSAPTKTVLTALDDLKKTVKSFDPFDKIGGYADVKREIKLWLHLLQHPQEAAEFGIKLEKGGIFLGPPGTGKTLFARCIAKAVNGGFESVSGADFANKYLGETAKNIRTLFEKARKEAQKTGRPVVVFIDEIDAIGRRRGTGGNDGASAEMENALNTLLAEIDGMDENQNNGLIIIGATNRPEVLDQALTRTGRLGTKFNISLPDEEARKAIFNVHSKNKPLDKELNLERWSELTDGMSGSDIEALMSAAAKHAFEDYVNGGREAKTVVENDVLEAFKTHIVGRKNHTNNHPKDLELVVHHETFGHNAIAYALGYDIKIVTSVGRGDAAGYVLPTPGTKSRYEAGQMRSMLAELVYGLAGQAAEEALRGPAGVTYGAGGDYQSARRRITQMITSGMVPGHGTEDYSQGYAGMGTRLSPKDQKLAAYLLKTSYETALKMIKAIPADVKQGMIDEAMGGIDYSFDDAMDFNRRHLGELDSPVITPLREIFDKHVDTVLAAVKRNAEKGAEEYAGKAPENQQTVVTFGGGNKDNVVALKPQRKNRLNVFS